MFRNNGDQARLLAFLAEWRTKAEMVAEVRSWKPPEYFLRQAQRRAATRRQQSMDVNAGAIYHVNMLLCNIRRRVRGGVLRVDGDRYRWEAIPD